MMSRISNLAKATIAVVIVVMLGAALVLIFGSQIGRPSTTPVVQATSTMLPYPPPPASPTVPPPTPTPVSAATPTPLAPFKVVKEIQLTKGEDVRFYDWSPASDNVLVGKYTGQTLQIDPTTAVLLADLWQYSITEAGTMTSRQLVANARDARWSPDGQRILYLSPVDAQRQDVYVMDRGGEQKTRVASGGYEWFAYWLPDNKICYEKDAHLWVVNADGQNARVLNEYVNLKRTSSSEAWRFYLPSPDGRRLAYSEGRRLFLMNLDGSERRQVADDVALMPAWSTDGQKLAYIVGLPEQLWVVKADGSAPQRLISEDRGHISGLSWFPGGELLVFCQTPRGTNMYECCAETYIVDEHGNIWLLGNGEVPRALIEVAPDGQKILFERRNDLWVGFLSASK